MYYIKKVKNNDGTTKYYCFDRTCQVEICEEVYKTIERAERAERHQKRMLWKHGVISFDAATYDGDALPEELREACFAQERLTDAIVIRDALLTLTEAERRAIRLKYWLGCSNTQIADSLGVTQRSVCRFLKSARSKLALLLSETEDGGSN